MTSRKKYSSLSRGLVLWFLLLSLLPLSIVSWISYQQAKTSLTHAAAEGLEQSSKLSMHFIRAWFKYRLMDLNSQAESQNNILLLSYLIEGLRNSGQFPAEYVKSYNWAQQVDGIQNDLVTLARRYDYIYDLYLIDNEGNILYTVARETDLGGEPV